MHQDILPIEIHSNLKACSQGFQVGFITLSSLKCQTPVKMSMPQYEYRREECSKQKIQSRRRDTISQTCTTFWAKGCSVLFLLHSRAEDRIM